MILGIEHTAIASADHRALADWYVRTFGFTINYQSATTTFVRAQNGNMIEIITAEGERAQSGMKSPGLRHLAIAVKDFDRACADLRARDVKFLTEPADLKGVKVVFFTDPEGNILHLLEREQPLP